MVPIVPDLFVFTLFMLFTVFLSTEKAAYTGCFQMWWNTYIIQLTQSFLAVSQSVRLNGNCIAKYRKYFDLNKENYTHSIVQDSNVLFQFINAKFFYLGKEP